jgi:hypothetical protein
MSICQKIRDLRRAFSSFCISFIGRDDNNAAHLYAKQISDLVVISGDAYG